MAGLRFKTWAYSFLQGQNRQVEELLWDGFYAQNVHQTVKLAKGQSGTFSEMVLYGTAENIIASALTLRAIEDLVRPLPYPIRVPSNLLRSEWDLDAEVGSADEFMATLLQQRLGVSVTTMSKHTGGWVIVDPDLMPDDTLTILGSFIQAHGQQALILLRRGIRLPAVLRGLPTAIYYPTDALAPFVDPRAEEALFHLGHTYYTVVGAGHRLLPAIIGVCDAVLQNTDTSGLEPSNEFRRQIVMQFVKYLPVDMSRKLTDACLFDTSWWSGARTIREAACQLLEEYGYQTEEIPELEPPFNAYTKTGDFAIVPRWM